MMFSLFFDISRVTAALLYGIKLRLQFLYRVIKKDMKADKNIHRYFHLDDVVINEEIWGKQLFIIHNFGGNWYLPELYVHRYGKPQTIGNSCNWDVSMTTLIDSPHRPFKKLKKPQLIKLLKSGSEKIKEDIKREMLIRTNRKIYGFI